MSLISLDKDGTVIQSEYRRAIKEVGKAVNFDCMKVVILDVYINLNKLTKN